MKEKLRKIFTKNNIFRYFLPLLLLLTILGSNLSSLNAHELPSDQSDIVVNVDDNFLTAGSATYLNDTWYRVPITMNRPYIPSATYDILFFEDGYSFGSNIGYVLSTVSYSTVSTSIFYASTTYIIRDTQFTYNLGLSTSGNTTLYLYVNTSGGAVAATSIASGLLSNSYIYRASNTSSYESAFSQFTFAIADVDAAIAAAEAAAYAEGVAYGEQHPVGSQLLELFSFIVGIIVNIFLFILTLEVFDISLLAIATVMFVVVGIIWVLKLIRG